MQIRLSEPPHTAHLCCQRLTQADCDTAEADCWWRLSPACLSGAPHDFSPRQDPADQEDPRFPQDSWLLLTSTSAQQGVTVGREQTRMASLSSENASSALEQASLASVYLTEPELPVSLHIPPTLGPPPDAKLCAFPAGCLVFPSASALRRGSQGIL
ncbi:hypothetical protein TREES_T100011046 [Tupaia chinensis]|uniref:Uncharacterized protein n=1 Tax=Tupaia chinensis TaxID=246437 RepID=L9JCJ5_TUPCH|nr:hypothetical protein TREES_T100011046 [Tupaia chinensis]